MKKIIFAIAGLFIAGIAFSQADSVLMPYKKFPTYPPVKLLMPDSVSYYSKEDLPKKKAVMLIIFNPGCEHCQHETEEIVKNIDKFNNVQIVMTTMMSMEDLRNFITKYKLDQYKNIVVTRDVNFFLASFYSIHNLPFIAFYNKKKEFISTFEGNMPIEKVLEELEK
jgi:thioredoxin-related protein